MVVIFRSPLSFFSLARRNAWVLVRLIRAEKIVQKIFFSCAQGHTNFLKENFRYICGGSFFLCLGAVCKDKNIFSFHVFLARNEAERYLKIPIKQRVFAQRRRAPFWGALLKRNSS